MEFRFDGSKRLHSSGAEQKRNARLGRKMDEAISGDWGGQPIRDYLSATDFAKTLPYVDGNRVAAVGASYGGYSVFMLAGFTRIDSRHLSLMTDYLI
jgi:dienelactone hydrolase